MTKYGLMATVSLIIAAIFAEFQVYYVASAILIISLCLAVEAFHN